MHVRISAQADRSARTRNALLESAARGLSRYGYGNLVLARVAGEAGYTRGALYHQFKDKEDLTLAVIEWAFETWREEVGFDRLDEQRRDPVGALFALARGHAVFCRRDVARLVIALRLEFSGQDHAVGREVERVYATIVDRCAELDPAEGPVPVAPAAHYLIGGVRTDLDGRTTVRGLYAVGEAACTGLHGANRLASNSLSECFVFGARAAAAAIAEPEPASRPAEPDWRFEPPGIETREALWRLAGPRRSAEELERLLDDPYPLARLVARSAIARRESRGAHRRADHPLVDPDLDLAHFVVGAAGEVRAERWV